MRLALGFHTMSYEDHGLHLRVHDSLHIWHAVRSIAGTATFVCNGAFLARRKNHKTHILLTRAAD